MTGRWTVFQTCPFFIIRASSAGPPQPTGLLGKVGGLPTFSQQVQSDPSGHVDHLTCIRIGKVERLGRVAPRRGDEIKDGGARDGFR
jgi:hypothetical protein